MSSFVKRLAVALVVLFLCGIYAEYKGVTDHIEQALEITIPRIGVRDPELPDLPSVRVELPTQRPRAGSAQERDQVATALDNLAGIGTAGKGVDGYERSQFGNGWATSGGCNTRDAILARDLTNVKYAPGSTCRVASGTLDDPYSGKTIDFVRGPATSQAVEIDHVVAAEVAWRHGGHRWSSEKRVEFFNDPMNLLAVDGPTNGAKSNKTLQAFATASMKDGSAVIAPESICMVTATYVNVMAKYELPMGASDIRYAKDTLKSCA